MTVTFFGHGDAPRGIMPNLKAVLSKLIEKEGAQRFYVGNHGSFDCIVSEVLCDLRIGYPHIECFVVLAYMPQTKEKSAQEKLDTLLPCEIAVAVPRFAISKRNEWMLKNSDWVVTYVKRSFGGAAKYKEMAIRKGKRVTEISQM